MKFTAIKDKINKYYSDKIIEYGATSKGVDWNSTESQELRFKQLLKLCPEETKFSINDLGCGYGYMYEYMQNQKFDFEYFGFDLSDEMVTKAKKLYSNNENCNFFVNDTPTTHDYTIASGIFNVKIKTTTIEWEKYVLDTLNILNSSSKKGFSFNILTKYSDKEFRRDDLYYADPCFYFDFCKKNFSKNVALLHDYDLYEFTILVKKS